MVYGGHARMRIVVKIKEKGWFEGLGLHHALIAVGIIAVGHFLSFGEVACGIAIGGFFFREEKEYELAKRFEILDFLSPAIVAGIYLFWSN